jgi:hypothetical protein
LNVDHASDIDFFAPCLVRHGNLLELLSSELEVILVQAAGGLETPGRCADEVVVEPFVPQLTQENANVAFQDVGHHFQVLK